MGQVVAEKLFGTYKQTDGQTDRTTLQKNPHTYPNFPFRDVSLTRTHLSTGRLIDYILVLFAWANDIPVELQFNAATITHEDRLLKSK